MRLTPISAAAAVALIAGMAVAGCGSTTSSTAADQAGAAPAATTPAAAGTSATCANWAGLPYLQDVAEAMWQLAGDEGSYGTGSDAVNSDQMAVAADQEGFSQIWPELPSPYNWDVQDDVLEVYPDTASPAQLNSAGADAATLAQQIGDGCPGA